MENKRRWTTIEDNVLKHNITICADNITEACRKTAPIINRTEKACSFRWYNHLSKQSTCFTLLSEKCEKDNRKVTKKKKDKDKKKSNFIKRLFEKLFS